MAQGKYHIDLLRSSLVEMSIECHQVSRQYRSGDLFVIIMTRQEMQKLLAELDHKHVENRDNENMEEPYHKLLEKLKKKLLH